MSDTLKTLQEAEGLFLPAISQLPQGRYVHFVLVRETESFPLFQTDGTLNIIRVQAGMQDNQTISRLVMFKRKQTTPERLRGREMLRYFDIISDSGERACEYNSDKFCKRCPDCILYGYAIGSEGAEKSKVYVDSAFSITNYEDSHKAFSFNALHEHGTMTKAGVTRSSFGEQDHVIPQVFFPAVVTLRDPTYESFLYVLGNILQTSRYGAQDSRTGTVHNHLIAVTFANGEIFSNLRYSQALHDALQDQKSPLARDIVLNKADEVYGNLIKDEPVFKAMELTGNSVETLRQEVTTLYQSEVETKRLLNSLDKATGSYAEAYGAKKKGK
ncbi:MAG: type I-D CRISPR-associated protein Cas7/Csc2 [Anaerolineales bacterium]|nr:type I-D CRISPR-associated protein Cas7/Csc2 [Anaerolineales bacterium]